MQDGGKLAARNRVYEYVTEQILAGSFVPGDLLTEASIAEAVGLSRTPVRECFTVLERDGWIRLYPGRGAIVSPVSSGEVSDVLQLRHVLEVWAFGEVARKPPSERLLADLRDAVEEQRLAGQHEFARAGQRFHRILVDAVGNRLFSELAASLFVRQLRLGATAVDVDSTQDVRDRVTGEHEALMAALIEGDRDKCLEMMDEHMTGIQDLARRPHYS